MSNPDIKNVATRRIQIMKGHLDALQKMINKGRKCVCLLDQSLAIQNSLKSLDTLILEKYLESDVAEKFRKNKKNAIKDFLEVFKRKQSRIDM